MPKRVFWPAAMVVMGLIFVASNLGLLPRFFWNLWPIILIVVGLGGLLISDREEWDVESTKKIAKTKKSTPKKKATKTTRRKK